MPEPTTAAEAWADGYIAGLADAGNELAANTRTCTCGVLTGGIRDPRPDCEAHSA